MIIIQLTGGLGNQLFQYASAKALSLHHGEVLKLEVSSFYRRELPDLEVPRNFELYNFSGVHEELATKEELQPFEINSSWHEWRNKLKPKGCKKFYKEPFYHFDKRFFRASNNVFLSGLWQSEKYFKDYQSELVKLLQLKNELITNVLPIAKQIKAKTSVAVHIRRNDYLRKPIILEWHGVMTAEYYKSAFEELKKRIGPFDVYYFTDDVNWVESELMSFQPGTIISNTIAKTHWEDFYLMQTCNHNIIANSTFSWWAAWLNQNPGKIVIAPNKWFNNPTFNTKDVMPENWIRF